MLREHSPNLPETINGQGSNTTTSTLTNSSTRQHVHFDNHFDEARLDRTSLLALEHMPHTDSDDEDIPARGSHYKTSVEEEEEHDLNDLADYTGDSDDEGPNADDILGNPDNFNNHCDSETAVVHDEGYSACDDIISAEEHRNQQASAEAPLLLPGAPVGWKPPGPPEDWKVPKPKTTIGQPDVPFEDIDNPGEWSSFTFRPKFLYKGRTPTKFLYHCMPTDATPVPINKDGSRTCNNFEFFYNGWTRKESDPSFRSGATRDNLHPECRKGSLDADLLSKLGLANERMYDPLHLAPDSLFFYQLLLPIHDIANNGSGIDGDPRRTYYPHVAECTEVYAITDLKLRGSGRGHRFKETSPQELVKWDGVLVFDGVLGGSKGAMLRRFDRRRQDNSSFNKHVADAMTPSRWLKLKRAIKLNNNLTATKRGDPNHDPAQKFDYMFKVLVCNTNALTKHAYLDQCGDETTWMIASYAEPGSGLIRRGLKKPGGSRGGQTVIVSDVDRMQVRAYIHRHKLHPRHLKTGYEGNNEVKLIIDQLLEMVIDGANNIVEPFDEDFHKPKGIFRELPHVTWDNYFSGDKTMTYAANSTGKPLLLVDPNWTLIGQLPSSIQHPLGCCIPTVDTLR